MGDLIPYERFRAKQVKTTPIPQDQGNSIKIDLTDWFAAMQRAIVELEELMNRNEIEEERCQAITE